MHLNTRLHPPLGWSKVSVEDHRANQYTIYLTFRAVSKTSASQQSMKPLSEVTQDSRMVHILQFREGCHL